LQHVAVALCRSYVFTVYGLSVPAAQPWRVSVPNPKPKQKPEKSTCQTLDS